MLKTNGRRIGRAETNIKYRMMKIGEVSTASGMGIEALRFYERSGLLGSPARSVSGYRLYDDGVLERLAFIKKAQMLGFSLDEIRRIISDALKGTSPCDEVREIVRQRLTELDTRLLELKRYRKELAQALNEWDEVGSAPGHICGLIETTEFITPSLETSRIVRNGSKKINDIGNRKGKK